MSHHCAMYGRIEEENGKIYRYVRAEYGTDPETQEVLYSLDVFRECLETGICEARNIHFVQIGGWLVDFPGEKAKKIYGYSYYNPSIVDDTGRIKLEEWWQTGNYEGFANGFNEVSMTTVKLRILEAHPELKYLMAKLNIDNQFQYSKLFKIIHCYWKHPESETLFQLGCYDLAMNENLYKLSKPKLKEILKCVTDMKNNNQIFDVSLRDIQKYLKKVTDMSFIEWWNFYCWNDMNYKWSIRYDYQTYKYCVKKNISKYEYNDYLQMAKKVGHDIEDDYWKYPNDFHKMHDKCMEQIKNLEVAKFTLQQEFMKEVMKPMLKFNAKVDGCDIFISTDAKEWQLTCDTLYQCLMRNGYMKNVIFQRDIIVFIWKNGVPQATAQLDYDNNLHQFYADESGHRNGDDCLPNEEIQAAFEKWHEVFKPTKSNFKFETNKYGKTFYKGFTEIVEGGFHTYCGCMDGEGKGSTFLIGQSYDTNFDDEEILGLGGKCESTERVYHFCNSITEIDNHYTPKYYAEIQPLGPIVENHGALLSNRIKIIRMIPAEEVAKIKTIELANQAILSV